MFRKILIANRGEIACRIIKTARAMGVATVAVYSEADADARHVRLADEAVLIGAASAQASYLNAERILDAARQTGAQAIHPGYGFLSENDAFADACTREGFVFIGPPATAIRAMGLKSAAKALMEKAHVPLTPGYHGANQDAHFLAGQAESIGFPVLIKASAGGGGKGMRRVDSAAEFQDALNACKREARSAFGDDDVLVEKYILQPRHIEIQVFGDTHGNYVYLFERDCSVQRRHQKVLEEAPAPGVTPERRAAMGQAAVDAARAVSYVGAGTVEFIAMQDGTFFFMEMNTRLQVEHPVTEMITGLDLVEWQLRVASGEPLPLRQEHLRMNGHAIEARIYAEDPDRGFLPATGRLNHLAIPAESASVRVDTGVEQGDVISPHYDPMIAKLIVWGEDRTRALDRMQQALAQYQVSGVSNNIEFLKRLVASPSFSDARLDTDLIEREQTTLFPASSIVPTEVWMLTTLAELLHERRVSAQRAAHTTDPDSPWRTPDSWRLNGESQRQFIFQHRATTQEINVVMRGDACELSVGPERQMAHGSAGANGCIEAHIGTRRLRATVIATASNRNVFYDGHAWALSLVTAQQEHEAESNTGNGLRAPMPGLVVALSVAPGTHVEPGTPLLVIEAMKMEHTIHAPHKGVVKAFRFKLGDQVPDGAELVDFEGAV